MKKGLVKTDNVIRGTAALQDLELHHKLSPGRSFVLIEGLTGRGKTLFSEWYAVQKDCAYLEADPDWTPSWLMRAIAGGLGLAQAHSLEINKRQIVELLRNKSRTLIIDEADRVIRHNNLLDTMRGLHDQALVPIVLVGEGGAWGRIARKSPRFADRVRQVVEFRDASAADIEAAAKELAGLELGTMAAYLAKEVQGNFRRAAKVIEEMEQIFKANPGALTRAKMELALGNLRLQEMRAA